MDVTDPGAAEGTQEIDVFLQGGNGETVTLETTLAVEPCLEMIPTLTHGGALILALLIGAGAVCLGRKRRRAA